MTCMSVALIRPPILKKKNTYYYDLKQLSFYKRGAEKLKINIMCIIYRGVPRIWEGGGQEIFFQIWEFACREATCCAWRSHAHSKPCALLGGFGGMLPRENFLKRCNLVRFRVYFDQILSLFFSKNAIFLYKK